MTQRLSPYLPGLVLSTLVALAATLVSTHVPLLSSMVVAIILGVVLRNTGCLPARVALGLRLSAKKVLRVGVVLLGLRLSVPAVLSLGWGAVGVIVMTVASVYVITVAVGTMMRLPRATVLLTATGTAICGAAAVAGMSAVVRSDGDGEDVQDAAATAIASVTLFGMIEILMLPLLVRVLGLDATSAGLWVGSSVHEVGQVVAAAGLVSSAVLDVAVVAKLGRVVLLAPLVAVVGVRESRERESAPLVPLFVLGFLAMVVVRAVLDPVLPASLWGGTNVVATFLLTMAMFAMGAEVRLGRLLRTGLPALGLGAVASLVSLAVSLGGRASSPVAGAVGGDEPGRDPCQ